MNFDQWDKLLEDEYNAMAGLTAVLLQEVPHAPLQTSAQVVTATIVFRTMSFYRSIKLLLAAKEGMDGVRTLVRSCVENMFVCVVLAKEGDKHVEEMVGADGTATQKFAEFILRQKLYSGEDEAKFWKKQARGAKAAKGEIKMPGELAKSTEAVAAYFTYAEMSNDAAHVTIRALGRYLAPDRLEFIPEPEPTTYDEASCRNYLSMALLSIMLAVIEVHGRAPTVDLVGPLWERHTHLAKADAVMPAEGPNAERWTLQNK